MKKLIIFFLLFLIIACNNVKVEPTKQPLPDNNSLIKGSIDNTPIYNEPSEKDFINENFPKSKIMLNSTVVFTKEYIPIYIASNVLDLGYSNELIYLNKNKIITQNKNCPSLIANDFKNIQVKNNFILANNEHKMVLFDLNECGSILEGQMKLKNVKLIPPYLIFYEDNTYSINLIGKYDTYFSGKTKDRIMDVGGSKEFLSLVTNKGELVTIDLKEKNIIYSGDIGINLLKWRFDRYTLFGITDNKNFTSVTTTYNGQKFLIHRDFLKNISIYNYCTLAKNKVAINCDNYLITKNKNIKLDKKYDKFILIDNNLYGIKNNDLFKVLIDKKRMTKKVNLKKYDFKSCMDNETIYFKDLDDKIRKTLINSDTVYEVNSFGNCKQDLLFKDGFILNNNQKVYDFAKKIRKENNISLYKRIIGHDTYYFYSKQ